MASSSSKNGTIGRVSSSTGTTGRELISTGGGSLGGSIRGQNGYRDALLNISKQDDRNTRNTNNGTRMNYVNNTLVGEQIQPIQKR